MLVLPSFFFLSVRRLNLFYAWQPRFVFLVFPIVSVVFGDFFLSPYTFFTTASLSKKQGSDTHSYPHSSRLCLYSSLSLQHHAFDEILAYSLCLFVLRERVGCSSYCGFCRSLTSYGCLDGLSETVDALVCHVASTFDPSGYHGIRFRVQESVNVPPELFYTLTCVAFPLRTSGNLTRQPTLLLDYHLLDLILWFILIGRSHQDVFGAI